MGDFRTDVGRIASKVSMATIIWEEIAKLQLAENITYAMMEFGKTTITDIKKWRGDNLLPNPSIKRMNIVKNAA